MKNALILFPHQLFPIDQLPDVERIVVVEEPLLFGMDQQHPLKLHKQRLILMRAAMQRYVEEVLWKANKQVDYIELDVFMNASDLLERVKGFEQIYMFDPVDETLTARLLQARRERADGPPIQFLPSPNFYLKEQEVREYFDGRKKAFTTFYQWQRERFNILIGNDYKPLGGKWILETKGQKKLPAAGTLPSFAVFGDNKYVHSAIDWVNEHFPDNPGSTDFIWPTNHEEALAWLEDFVESRLDHYADYQDVIDSKALWLFHSALSSSLNSGLLSPQQVVTAAVNRHDKRPVDLPSLEAFIRQVLGWREYMRSLYLTQSAIMHNPSVFKHQRRMTSHWYDGKLDLPPFDDLTHKLRSHGYAHNIERLMIAGNLMLLCEIHPEDIQKWFSQLLIDATDWLMLPNIYGLHQFGEGAFGGKPAISASNYILQVSDYERGEWADVWDGLFWRFVEKHRDTFKHNSTMRVMLQRLDRLDPDRKRIVGYRAEDFLNNFTQ